MFFTKLESFWILKIEDGPEPPRTAIMLSRILTLPKVTDRCSILKDYLHSTETVSTINNDVLLQLFMQYYTPDIGDRKYERSEIAYIYVAKHPLFHTKGFYLKLRNGFAEPVAYKRLAGEKRSEIENLKQALRSEIRPQIDAFRRENPLNPAAFCPLEYNCPLGTDAQIDHYSPTFRHLLKEWITVNPAPKVTYNKERCLFELLEPHKTSWIQYHSDHAKLRWLSKVGNQKAHLM